MKLMLTLGENAAAKLDKVVSDLKFDSRQETILHLINQAASGAVPGIPSVSREPRTQQKPIAVRRREKQDEILKMTDAELPEFIKGTGYLRQYAFHPENADKIYCTVQSTGNARVVTVEQDGGASFPEDLKETVWNLVYKKFVNV